MNKSLKLLLLILVINKIILFVNCDFEDNEENEQEVEKDNNPKTTKANKPFIKWSKNFKFGKSDKRQNISNLMFIVNDLKNTTTDFINNKKTEKIDLFRAFRPQNLSSTIWHKLNSKSFPETLKAANSNLSKEFEELKKIALKCARFKSNDPNCKRSLESVKSMFIACKNRSLSKEDCSSFKNNFCTAFPKFPSCIKVNQSLKVPLNIEAYSKLYQIKETFDLDILNKNFMSDIKPNVLKKLAVDCSTKKEFDEKCSKVLNNLKSNLKNCVDKPKSSHLECDRFKGVFCEAFPKFFCCPEMTNGKTCDGKAILNLTK